MHRIDTRTAPTAYILLMAAWVFGFAHLDRDLAPFVVFAALLGAGAIQVALGYILGRWAAVSLAVVPVVLAVAASGSDSGLWFTVVVLTIFPGAPFIALGVFLRRWKEERDDPSPDAWLYGERPEL
ncbi:MAG TPA: hypothetical protein VHF67_14260 [Gaiellaceae bacterium]|nr:hypothetical protein [Gaiellaceae bacterium]